MGLLNLILGASSSVDPAEIATDVSRFLPDDEKIVAAYRTYRDLFVFTNRRLITADKEGMTGKKQAWTFMPYNHIVRYSITTTGYFEVECELRLWTMGQPEPVIHEFRNDKCIMEICQILGRVTP